MALTAEDLLARLCAMVPPPRFHFTRYAGVLASNAALRTEVVPGDAKENERSDVMSGTAQGELFGEEMAQLYKENKAEKTATWHPVWFCGVALEAGVRGGGSRVRALCRQFSPRGDRDGGHGDQADHPRVPPRGPPRGPPRVPPRGPPGQLMFAFR